MLNWHEHCLKIVNQPLKVLKYIEHEKHDINEKDAMGMTLLMRLVSQTSYNELTKALLQSSEATQKSLRKPIDLNSMNKNGEDVFLLASAAKNKEIQELLDIEHQRIKRLQEHASKIGYHDTSSESYDYILKDLKHGKFPMIGGSGGYFGGGIYFALSEKESFHKALSHGRGFKCELFMGNIYKISSLAEKDTFYNLYFNGTHHGAWYKTPSDVIRMRLLTWHGKSYDSVWGHYDDNIASVNQRILPTGDEYVVFSADQVKVQETFILFNEHWISTNVQTPRIYDSYQSIKHIHPGDVRITHRDEDDTDEEEDQIAFAYKDTKYNNRIVFTPDMTEETFVVVPDYVTKDLNNAILHYKPILYLIDQIYLSSSDAYFKTLFPNIPSNQLYPILQNYQIYIEPNETSIIFKPNNMSDTISYDLTNELLFIDSSDIVFEHLSKRKSTLTLKYDVLIDNKSISVDLPSSLMTLLKQLILKEKATKTIFDNELKITMLEEKEFEFINQLHKLLQNYLLREKNIRKQYSSQRKSSKEDLPVFFQPTGTQRSYARYFISDIRPTDAGFSIPDEFLQHGDIVGLKNNESYIWFYVRPSLEKEGSFISIYISDQYSTLTIPIEVTQHLLDSETYYKELLKNRKYIKANTIRLTISPYDIFWKNKKIFKSDVLKEIGYIFETIRKHHSTFIDYSIDYTLTKKSRSKGYIWIRKDPTDSIYSTLVYGAPMYLSKMIIKTLTDIYWDPKPLVITIDLSIHSSNSKILKLTNVFDNQHINSLFPKEHFKWTIEESPTYPSKLILHLPRYISKDIREKIEKIFKTTDGWLPFGYSSKQVIPLSNNN